MYLYQGCALQQKTVVRSRHIQEKQPSQWTSTMHTGIDLVHVGWLQNWSSALPCPLGYRCTQLAFPFQCGSKCLKCILARADCMTPSFCIQVPLPMSPHPTPPVHEITSYTINCSGKNLCIFVLSSFLSPSHSSVRSCFLHFAIISQIQFPHTLSSATFGPSQDHFWLRLPH